MSHLYFRQLLAGRDFAISNAAAAQMENFVYLIGDKDTGECLVIDPAWDIQGIIDVAARDHMKITKALATHYHPDHIGGHIFGLTIEGLPELLAKNPVKVYAHKLEVDGIKKVTGISDSDLVPSESGDVVKVGDIAVELLHTPGHTPGSLCFRLKDTLISGDTLFLTGCGRVDLPGGNVEEMYRTIHERFNTIAQSTIVYPGHNYGGDHDSMGHLRDVNPAFRYIDLKDFRKLFR